MQSIRHSGKRFELYAEIDKTISRFDMLIDVNLSCLVISYSMMAPVGAIMNHLPKYREYILLRHAEK